MDAGVLISQCDCAPEQQAEFDAWYDGEHIPIRLALTGFAGAERYHLHAGEAPRHLVVYHLDDLGVLDSAAYDDVKRGSGSTPRTQRMLGSLERFTRYTGVLVSDTHPELPLERPGRFAVVTLTRSAEPASAPVSASGTVRSRRYRLVDSSPPGMTHAQIHELDDESALPGLLDALQPGGVEVGEQLPTAVYRRRADRPNASPAASTG